MHMCHSHPVCLASYYGVSPCGMCQPVHATGGGGLASNHGNINMDEA